MVRRDPLLNANNPSRSSRLRLVIATILVVVLFCVDALTGGSIRALVRTAIASTSHAASAAGAALATSGVFSSAHRLALENEDLKNQITAYQARETDLASREAHLLELESLARVAETKPGVSAPILSSVISSPYGTFVVGAGASDGVSVGDVVVLPDGFAVGKVAEVNARRSVVQEFFSPGAQLNVHIGATEVRLTGSGGENASGQAPRGTSIETGDIVESHEYKYPVGLVGAVASSSAAEAAQDILVRVPDNLSAIKYVYIVAL